MKYTEVKIDLKELEKEKKINSEERLKFIDLWANYVKTHSDKNWSEQQAMVINNPINPRNI